MARQVQRPLWPLQSPRRGEGLLVILGPARTCSSHQNPYLTPLMLKTHSGMLASAASLPPHPDLPVIWKAHPSSPPRAERIQQDLWAEYNKMFWNFVKDLDCPLTKLYHASCSHRGRWLNWEDISSIASRTSSFFCANTARVRAPPLPASSTSAPTPPRLAPFFASCSLAKTLMAPSHPASPYICSARMPCASCACRLALFPTLACSGSSLLQARGAAGPRGTRHLAQATLIYAHHL